MATHNTPDPKINRRGTSCRVFGKDFPSMAHAARYYDISPTWVREMVSKGINEDVSRESVRKVWKAANDNIRPMDEDERQAAKNREKTNNNDKKDQNNTKPEGKT